MSIGLCADRIFKMKQPEYDWSEYCEFNSLDGVSINNFENNLCGLKRTCKRFIIRNQSELRKCVWNLRTYYII